MSAPASKRRLLLPKVLFALVIAAIALVVAYATLRKPEWKIPADANKLKNPVPPSQEALKAGRELFLDKCSQCHGEEGKGDGSDAMMYDPPPADLTDTKRMLPQADGELFYKISNGKKPMPAFKKRLTEDQRWHLVLLVRSFTQKPAAAPEEKPGAAPSR